MRRRSGQPGRSKLPEAGPSRAAHRRSEDFQARSPQAGQAPASQTSALCPTMRSARITRSGCNRHGIKPAQDRLMNDKASAVASHEQQDGASNRRLPVQGKIGFVGLGRMGTAMAANLAAAGHHVIAYVRRQDHRTSSQRSVSPHDRHHRSVRLRDCHQHAAGRRRCPRRRFRTHRSRRRRLRRRIETPAPFTFR